MYERFTDRARKVMQLANQEAQRFNHEYIGTEHVLLGLVKEGSGLAAQVLKDLNADLRKIRLDVEKLVQRGPDVVTMGRLPQTPRAKKVIEYAIEEARNLGHNYVGTEHLLLGLLREDEGVGARVLRNLGLKLEDVREEVLNVIGRRGEPADDWGTRLTRAQASSRTPALDAFGRDLTDLAERGLLDPVLGRDEELQRLVQVLSCLTGNCPLMVGAPGVGKTALIEGVAQLIAAERVPESLRDRRLIAIDADALYAGNEAAFGKRLKAALHEANQDASVILALDPLPFRSPTAPAPAALAWDLIGPAVARGEVQCIASVTRDQPADDLGADGGLVRLFRVLAVRPLARDKAIEVLRARRGALAEHHSVAIRDDALDAAVAWADRYITDRHLPGGALQLVDEACALVQIKTGAAHPDLQALDEQIKQLQGAKEAAIADRDYERAAGLRDEVEKLKARREQASDEWSGKPDRNGVVDRDAIPEAVSHRTGIPLARLLAKGYERPAAPAGSFVISYGDQDATFAEKLQAHLTAVGALTRLSPQSLEGARRQDTLLLVLSEDSLGSAWLSAGLRGVLTGDSGAPRLVPLRLVGSAALLEWECVDPRTGRDLADEVWKRDILDFTEWRDEGAFERAVAVVLRA